MMRFIEHSVFFRSLNYIRILHSYAIWYNWIYPIAIGLAISFLFLRPGTAAELFSRNALLNSFVPVLSILCPFYIAALAAVSTFTGLSQIDKPFEMSQPVRLEVLGRGGDWDFIDVTPRHFLSLLFGYCTTLSFFLLGISIFSPLIESGLTAILGESSGAILLIIAFIFFVFLAQLFVNTLLGVYYLSDKLHRQ